MAMWNPWRGCKKCSDGCLHCYIHKGDAKRNVDTAVIIKTKDFEKPIEKLKNGNYKMKSGIAYLCFSTDFLIEEADNWRNECQKCHNKYIPTYSSVLWAMHINRTRYMKCPKCNQRSWQKKVISK